MTGGIGWLSTDYQASGLDEDEALEYANGVANRAGWLGVRLGRELIGSERHAYCAIAWILAN